MVPRLHRRCQRGSSDRNMYCGYRLGCVYFTGTRILGYISYIEVVYIGIRVLVDLCIVRRFSQSLPQVHSMAGAVAGALQTAAWHPLDVLKTRRSKEIMLALCSG